MKSFMKKTLAVFLALMMLSGSFMCLAAVELNQDAVNAHYGQFKNYLLLGDSAASGYRDEISDNDAAFNEANRESTYYRVPGSYADVIANAIIEDKSMTAFAGPGYRTIEMRYMMEDDFAKTCKDEYLFWPSHLYTYENEFCAECGEYKLPGSEHFRKEFKNAIKEADLITLGVGGNDWGAYLGWVINQVLEKENYASKYAQQAADLLEGSIPDMSTVEKLVEIAALAGAIPELIMTIPEALNYGLTNFYTNWDIMIQDIYDLNPDVTLMVVGMSDNSIKGKNYDYEGVVGEPVEVAEQPEAVAGLIKTIVDFIMTVGNTPMIEGAKKFGYTYVNTDGTTYVESHPDADGHKFIANKIIEALPDRVISTKYEDVKPGHKYYASIEYVIKNNIMAGTSETTFSPDDNLTTGQLAAALNAINGTETATDGEGKVTVLQLATSIFASGAKKGIVGFFKSFVLMCRILTENSFNMSKSVSRGLAARYLKEFCEI